MVAAAVPQRAIRVGTDPDLIGEMRDLYGYIGGPGNGRFPKPADDTRPEFAYVFQRFGSRIGARKGTLEELQSATDDRADAIEDLAHQVQNKYVQLLESLATKQWKSVICSCIVASLLKRDRLSHMWEVSKASLKVPHERKLVIKSLAYECARFNAHLRQTCRLVYQQYDERDRAGAPLINWDEVRRLVYQGDGPATTPKAAATPAPKQARTVTPTGPTRNVHQRTEGKGGGKTQGPKGGKGRHGAPTGKGKGHPEGPTAWLEPPAPPPPPPAPAAQRQHNHRVFQAWPENPQQNRRHRGDRGRDRSPRRRDY